MAVPVPIDARVGGVHESSTSRSTQYVAPGEQVYAVQYRKVQFQWFSSRTVDNAELEKGCRWKVYTNYRSVSEDTENDVVEATLGEGLCEGDRGHELEELDVKVDGDDLFVFSS